MHLKSNSMSDGGSSTGRASISYPNNIALPDPSSSPSHAKESKLQNHQSFIGN